MNASATVSASAAAANAAMLMMLWRNADAKSPCDDASRRKPPTVERQARLVA